MSTTYMKDLFVNVNNKFSSKFLLNVLKSNKNPGFVVSPLSAIYPMTMTYLGSDKNTKNELGRCFEIKSSDEDLLKSSLSFMEFIGQKNKAHIFNLVNAMFVDRRLPLNKDFQKAMEKIGVIDNVNFKTDSKNVRLDVNKWIADNTNQLIPELFPEGSITADDVAIIVNTLYFKGKWQHAADNTFKNYDFTNSSGSKVKKDMMVFEEMTCKYHEDEINQMVAMPYKYDYMVPDIPHLEMVIVVPKKHQTGSFNLSSFNDNYQKMALQFVTVNMPKFEQRSSLSLVDTFKDMGVVDLFDELKSDVTKMAKTNEGNIYVSDILQEVVVIVDEEGTEAAAATAVKFSFESCMVQTKMPIRIVADHTFEYYIVDSVTGVIAFSGVYDG